MSDALGTGTSGTLTGRMRARQHREYQAVRPRLTRSAPRRKVGLDGGAGGCVTSVFGGQRDAEGLRDLVVDRAVAVEAPLPDGFDRARESP
jgi:hypothetical protein